MQYRPKQVALVLETRFQEANQLIDGIAAFNRAHERWQLFVDSGERSTLDSEPLTQGTWDGVILGRHLPGFLARAAAQKLPCVEVADDPRRFDGVPKVRPDNLAIGRKAADHLLRQGFPSYGFCGFSNEHWSLQRRTGFVSRLKQSGKTCQIIETAFPANGPSHWSLDEEELLTAWVSRCPRPVAIFCCNDYRAAMLLGACGRAGLMVPTDVAILGTNNNPHICGLGPTPLSSVSLDLEHIGQIAAGVLLDLIGGKPPARSDQLVFSGEVIPRESSSIDALGDAQVSAAMRLIREQATQGLRIDQICQHAHLSRSSLERRFRRLLGHSPQDMLRNEQLHHARCLLIQTDKKLPEIAEACGFEHPEHFCVVFKRITGMTPTGYRRQMKSASSP